MVRKATITRRFQLASAMFRVSKNVVTLPCSGLAGQAGAHRCSHAWVCVRWTAIPASRRTKPNSRHPERQLMFVGDFADLAKARGAIAGFRPRMSSKRVAE